MKVLRKGNSEGWEIKRTCTGDGNGGGGCKAYLLIEESDIYLKEDNRMGLNFTFKCPECGCETQIARKSIPQRIQNKVIDTKK